MFEGEISRVAANNLFLSKLADFAPVINREFPGENFFKKVEEYLQEPLFTIEKISQLVKLLISARLWVDDFVASGKHEGVAFEPTFVLQSLNKLVAEQKFRIEAGVLEMVRDNRRLEILKDVNFQAIQLPVGVDARGIAMTVTSIIDAVMQAFIPSENWALGQVTLLSERLIHPKAEAELRKLLDT